METNFLRKIAERVIKNKTKFDPKFDIYDIMNSKMLSIDGVVDHGLVPKRLSGSNS